MSVDLIFTGTLNGRTVRGLLLNHTVSDTPTGPTWYDEFDNEVSVGASDRLSIHTLTGSTDSAGGEQVKLETSGGVQVIRLYLGTNRSSFHDFSDAPPLLPPGSNLFAVTDVWSVSQLPNLWGWWDFSDDSNLTLSGSEITGALDQSGNSRDLVKSTSANTTTTGPSNTATINSVQAAGFSAGGPLGVDYPENQIDLGIVHVFAVAQGMTTGSNDVVVSTRDGFGVAWTLRQFNGTTLRTDLGAITASEVDQTITSGDNHLRAARFDQRVNASDELIGSNGSIVQAWLNGQATPDGDSLTGTTTWQPSNTTLGVGANPNGGAAITTEIGEVIVVNGDLTTDQRQRTEGYLAHKWGLEGDLPAGHPYKAAPP